VPAAPVYASSLAASGRRRPPQRATSKNSRLGFFGTLSGRTLGKHRSARRTAPGYRACGYKTASGRPKWINADPIGLRGGINLYAYCGNNPINFIDPFGLATVHYWARSSNGWGHLSITLDDGTYISNWPTNESNIVTTSDTRTPNYEEDKYEERGPPVDLYIGTLNEGAMKKWWKMQPRKDGYNGLSTNCSNTVANALRQGGLPVQRQLLPDSPGNTWPRINDAVQGRSSGGAGGSW
jgi:RHS repeat-associated protein